MQDFDQCKNNEIKNRPKHIEFYTKVLGLPKHIYTDWDEPDPIKREQYRSLQRVDVDVLISKEGSPCWYYISEKDRNADYGDMYIETWSNYDKRILGSYIKENKSNYILYQTPKGIYWVKHDSNFINVVHNLHNEVPRSVYDKLVGDNYKYPVKYHIDKYNLDVKLAKSESYRNGEIWHSTGIIVTWKDLVYKFGVRVSAYDLNFNKFNPCL